LEQFDTSAFEGPVPGSVGLESGTGYLRGCFLSSLDVSLTRTIRLLRGRSIELRADIFNVFNEAAVTNRNSVMVLPNPLDPAVVINRPFGPDGVIASRAVPRGAGFGVATDYQPPRIVQLQLRISF
jgi:hypothetical protein